MIYLSLPSAVTPVPYSDQLPVPNPQNNTIFDKGNSDDGEVQLDQVRERTAGDPIFGQGCPSSQHIS